MTGRCPLSPCPGRTVMMRAQSCLTVQKGIGSGRWVIGGLNLAACSMPSMIRLPQRVGKSFTASGIISRTAAQREPMANWALIGSSCPASESRRYLVTISHPNDISAGGPFKDVVAYGGWTMDDHHPAGFDAVKLGAPATIWHPAPSPYGIPYRTLYARDITNLMFAGRDASCTHVAMSSTRVMGTACVMGQAAGTAAALAVAKKIAPRGVNAYMHELQQSLLADDCYLPGVSQEYSALSLTARLTASQGDPEPVRDGINRPVGGNLHGWRCSPGDWLAYTFKDTVYVETVTLVLDSALDCLIALSNLQHDDQLTRIPSVMPRELKLEGLVDGQWREIARVNGNYQRLLRLPIGRAVQGIRVTLQATWGAESTTVYAFYLN